MITRGIVVFNPTAFMAQFPAFATPSPGFNATTWAAALTGNFNLATIQLNNSYGSIVQDEPTRAQLLNLLTAHITALLNGVNGLPPTGLVGRVSGATQGSVSVQTDFTTESEAAAFYAQTQWGALFWQLTVIYRTAQYVTPCDQRYGPSWEAWPE